MMPTVLFLMNVLSVTVLPVIQKLKILQAGQKSAKRCCTQLGTADLNGLKQGSE